MKVIVFFLFLCTTAVFGQKVKWETLLNDNISIRAIQLWDGKVWYSGTQSKFGYVDLKDPSDQRQIRLSDKDLQFRTLTQNNNFFYAINIESPAYLVKIDKGSLAVKTVLTDARKGVFYDALAFLQRGNAYGFSDSSDGRMILLNTDDGGLSWNFLQSFDGIPLQPGEAAFAASNTNIAGRGNYVWIATGGTRSRIFRLRVRNHKAPIGRVFATPFVQGSSSQGIYSIDFANEKFGVAVGGDYTRQAANINNIATTEDGGVSWHIQASGKNAGYMTCVKIRPGSDGKQIIAVGDQHISYSDDYGVSWRVISNEKNLYTCDWVNSKNVVFAGKDRILKMTFE